MNVFFHTFGCRANQYDTELVRQAFSDRGVAVVNDPASADVAVVNSCTVTQESEAKLRQFVRRLARRPTGRPLETVVMGCAAARDDGTLRALPSVRAVVGGADAAAVLSAAGLATRSVDPVLRRFGSNQRGWLKIQDGCDEHCSFCATTLARGANRSRSIAELVEEAKQLATHHAELVITGVHIGTYGKDLANPGRKPGVQAQRTLERRRRCRHGIGHSRTVSGMSRMLLCPNIFWELMSVRVRGWAGSTCCSAR